jgi:uncharacterized surface protein with fasciclin (FAS1) repeats
MRRWIIGLLAAGLLFTLLVSPAGASGKTLYDFVDASGEGFDSSLADFDVLEAAIDTAGLAGALDDPSAKLTVFAPRDAAFVRLAKDLGFTGSNEAAAWDFLVAALTGLGGGNPIPVLTNVLLYHVAPWQLSSGQVLARQEINTLLGVNIKVRQPNILKDLEPDIPNARIIAVDIKASNGIAHVIDRVLLPVDLP